MRRSSGFPRRSRPPPPSTATRPPAACTIGSTTAVARVSRAPRMSPLNSSSVALTTAQGSAQTPSARVPIDMTPRHRCRPRSSTRWNRSESQPDWLEGASPATCPRKTHTRSYRRIAPVARKSCRSDRTGNPRPPPRFRSTRRSGCWAVSTVADATKGTSRPVCPTCPAFTRAETITPAPILARVPTTEGERSQICISQPSARGRRKRNLVNPMHPTPLVAKEKDVGPRSEGPTTWPNPLGG